MTFLEDLIARGVVSPAQESEIVRDAQSKFGGNIDRALIAKGMPEDALLEAKSDYLGLPYKRITGNITPDILKYIAPESVSTYKFAPIGFNDKTLEIGVLEPENISSMDALSFISGKIGVPYKIFIIGPSDFDKILENYKGMGGEVDQALSQISEEEVFDADVSDVITDISSNKKELTLDEEQRIVEDAPIIKIVGVILRHATEGDASDIHIENTGDKVKVRFRVDGVLHTSLTLPQNVYSGIVARIKILSKLRLDEKRKPQDGGFSAKIDNRKIDFRVSTMPSYYGEKVVMRILDSEKGVKPIDELNLSDDNKKLILEALKKPYGLILITGPTGSGKSTTLYSMLNHLDKEKSNIVSLEDPVEYHIPDVNQSQMMPEIGYTFATGLRSVLRQDPDIIMVGEIRDKETAQLAIQAALTGHLVLSTLHTNNSIGVVPRLVDMGVDPYLIAPTLILSVAQRLVRKVHPASKKEVPMDDSTKLFIEKQFTDLAPEYKKNLGIGDKMFEIVPAAECPSGTKGRIAVFEMFPIDKEMQNIILKTPNENEIYKYARSKGMLTMKEDAIIKALKGDTPFTEVYNFN